VLDLLRQMPNCTHRPPNQMLANLSCDSILK
jgi:hypothetical protein